MSVHSTFSRNFLVSFADLLTLLLCFFILIYEQKQGTISKGAEQNQILAKNVNSVAVQKTGTLLASSSLAGQELGENGRFFDSISVANNLLTVKPDRGMPGVGVRSERMAKRHVLYERVLTEKQTLQLASGMLEALKGLEAKNLVLDSCDKDASIGMLQVAATIGATVDLSPRAGCLRKATLLMRRNHG